MRLVFADSIVRLDCYGTIALHKISLVTVMEDISLVELLGVCSVCIHQIVHVSECMHAHHS